MISFLSILLIFALIVRCSSFIISKLRFVSKSKLEATVQRDISLPGAGWKPDWENRSNGKQRNPEEFIQSDSTERVSLPECPLTRWDHNLDSIGGSVAKAQTRARELAEATKAAVKAQNVHSHTVSNTINYPPQIRADDAANERGVEYFSSNKVHILDQLRKHGSVWLRNFDLVKTVGGYRRMWEALGLKPCLDPLHSSGLRKFASELDGLYEEVNKPALRQHYIGLHQESTAKRTAAAAAFVCFQRASHEGGRFTVADGAAILADLKTETLERLYADGVRISVSNLDTPFTDTESGIGQMVRSGFRSIVSTMVAPKFDMDLEMVWEADKKRPGRLQAVESTESPINLHPISGVPIWFCNAHNHLRYLRDRRPCAVPEVGMTDVFLGPSMKPISEADCEEVRRACESNIAALPMEPGDVLLVDNYRALHGRETFEGDRFHAVTWFTWSPDFCPPGWQESDDIDATTSTKSTKNVLNKVVNKYMDWLPKDF